MQSRPQSNDTAANASPQPCIPHNYHIDNKQRSVIFAAPERARSPTRLNPACGTRPNPITGAARSQGSRSGITGRLHGPAYRPGNAARPQHTTGPPATGCSPIQPPRCDPL